MAILKSVILFLSFIISTSLYAECVKEGDSMITYPGAPQCCSGLELKRPTDGRVGSAGVCIKKKDCVEEGNAVITYPNAPKCCHGLELERPTDGRMGIAGICRDKKHLVTKKVDDSERSKVKETEINNYKLRLKRVKKE